MRKISVERLVVVEKNIIEIVVGEGCRELGEERSDWRSGWRM